MSSPRLAPWLIPETIRSGRPPPRTSSAERTKSTGGPPVAWPTLPSSKVTSATESGERVVMLRAVALRLESGAIVTTSRPPSATSARRRLCSPGAAIPSSLVRSTRIPSILGVGPADPRREGVSDTAGVTPVRLDIEYDGTAFRGWARQPEQRTVQGVLEAGLAQVLREEIQLTVAGRTDTGVHALGQVASFDTEAALPPDLARNLNGVTPEDIAVRRAEPAADGFNARFDARSRSYLYRVAPRKSPSPFERGRALWWP